jgi:hypothetical protein
MMWEFEVNPERNEEVKSKKYQFHDKVSTGLNSENRTFSHMLSDNKKHTYEF